MGLYLGTLDVGDAEMFDDLADVGAVPYRGRQMARRGNGYPGQRGGYGAGRGYPARRLIPQVPGAPAVGIRLQPLGFPTIAFVLNSGQALTARTQPQRPFKPKRLMCDIARTGTTATSALITVTSASIGTNNQFVSTDPIGAGAFSPLGVDANIEWAACTTALNISVAYASDTAITTTDKVAIATTMLGESVG